MALTPTPQTPPVAVVLAAALLVLAGSATAGPPPTPAEPVVDTIHGVEVVDPYRWLEGSAASELKTPDAALDARVAAWTAAQNAYARAVLDAIPGRATVAARLTELLDLGEVSSPALRGNRYFLHERGPAQNSAALTVREGPAGAPRVLVDPNALDAEGLTSLAWSEPSPDGSRVAFALIRGGDENTRLNLLDAATGDWLADEIPGKAGEVSWLPDSSGFFYRRYADPADPYSAQIRFHRVGSHPRFDPVLAAQAKEGPLATTWGPRATASGDGRWLIVRYWTSTDAQDLWAIDLDRWRRTGEVVETTIHRGEEARSQGPVVGDVFYMMTTLGAPNGRVVAVDLNHPERERWREVVAERAGATIQAVAAARGILAVSYLEAAVSRIRLFRFDGTPLRELPLPGVGATELATADDRTEALLSFTSFNQPNTVYRVDLASGERTPWIAPRTTFDPDAIEVDQVFYPSADGTRVPMFLVHKKGLPRDGDRPVLLYAYGGFGYSWTPRFDPTWFALLERGAVVAVANVRGGGELGEDWHRAGMREHKPNVVADWIAALEWLIAERYTRPGRIAIAGGSNGGISLAAVVNQRPELLGAVVVVSPLIDMLRYQNFLLARYWVPEYGSAEDPEAFAYLRRYSPYQHVRDGVPYPPVLIQAGENDSRVHPLHARKYAARLQAATTSDPATRPVLLYVAPAEGHGAGVTKAQHFDSDLDKRVFVMWRLGMLGDARR